MRDSGAIAQPAKRVAGPKPKKLYPASRSRMRDPHVNLITVSVRAHRDDLVANCRYPAPSRLAFGGSDPPIGIAPRTGA